jgi:hypothetical protein
MSIASQLSFSTATSLLSGSAGALPYQNAASSTIFLPLGTAGYVLTAGASAPIWTAIAGLTINTATNIAGGTAGQIHYQSSPGITAFAGPGSWGQFLISGGTGSPTYSSTLTTVNGNIVITSNSAATSTSTGALQIVNGGAGIGGGLYVGGATVINNNTIANSTSSGALQIVNGGLGVGGAIYGTVHVSVDATLLPSSSAGMTVANGSTSMNFIAYAGPGNYNPTTQVGDSLLYWRGTGQGNSGALNIAPWSSTATGIRITSAGVTTIASTVASSTTQTGALVVAGGVGIGFDLRVGGTIYGNVFGSISTATNLAGGSAGALVYQSAAGVTAFNTPGTAGQILLSGGTGAPVYTNTSSIYVNSALYADNVRGGAAGSIVYQSGANVTTSLALTGTAKSLLTAGATAPTWVTQVQAQSGTGSASATGAQSLVVTAGGIGVTGDSYFANNLGVGGNETITGTLTVSSTNANTGTNTSNALYTAGGAWIDKTLVVAGATTFRDTVTFNGTATYVLSTNSYFTDNLIEMHTPPAGVYGAWTVDDGKDIGFRFHYYKAQDLNAALVLSNSSSYLEWYSSGAESATSNFSTATYGTFRTGAIKLVGGAVNSGNTNSGDLTVLGGVGIGGSVYIGGSINVAGTINATVNGTITTATNLANGNFGQLHYQVTPGISGFLSTGTQGNILVSQPGAPLFTSTSSFLIGYSNNIAGGGNGALHYQSAPNVTSFLSTGTPGQLLVAGVGAPAFTNTSSIQVGYAANVLGGSANQFLYQSAANTTAFMSTGTMYVGNAVQAETIKGGSAGQFLYQSAINTTAFISTGSMYVNSSRYADNLTGGATGSIPIQSAAGSTAYIPIGTSGFVLTSGGTTATWQALSGLSSGSATTATNLANGTAGQVPYQTAGGSTSFFGPGTAGQLLQSGGTGAPSYINTTSVYIGRSIYTDNIWAGTAGQLHYQSAANVTSFLTTATTGNFLQANFAGAPTWSTTASMYVGGAISAQNIFAGTAGQLLYQSAASTTSFVGPGTAGQLLVSAGAAAPVYTNTASISVGYGANLLGGAAGSLPYQTAANATGMLAIGTNGYVLTSNGSAPTWAAVSGLTAGNATNAANIATIQQPASGTYYPTFVNANNASSANMQVFTTSSFNINPATGYVMLGTGTPGAPLSFTDATGLKIQLNANAANYYGFEKQAAVASGDSMLKYNAGNTAAGEHGFYSGGSLKVLITNSGNLLVNNTTANGKITIDTAAGSNWMHLRNGSESAFGLTVYNSGTGSGSVVPAYKIGLTYGNSGTGGWNSGINFHRGGSSVGGFISFFTDTDIERLRITQAGGISFGATGTATGSSGQVLQSNGDAPPTWVNVSGIGAGSATTASQVNVVAQPAAGTYYPTFVDSNNATALGELVYTTSSIVVNPGLGRVGINVTPSEALHVQGKIAIQNAANGYGWMYGVDTNHSIILRGKQDGTAQNSNSYYQYGGTLAGGLGHLFYTGGAIASQALRLHIADDGIKYTGVLIGGTSGFTKAAAGAGEHQFDNGTIDSPGVSFYYGNNLNFGIDTATWNASQQLRFVKHINETGGTILGGIDLSGNMVMIGEITAYFSDRRLKTNVKPIDNALDKVLSLHGITYTPNDLAASFGFDSSKQVVGLFADEVEAVLPEATKAAPFDLGDDGTSKSGENYRTVQYEKVVPLLVEAIKEQQKQIAQLTEMVKLLTNK